MPKFLAVPLAGLLLAASASTAHAGTSLSVSTSSQPRGVQLQVSAAAGTALDVSVSGGDDGVLTVTDPGGVGVVAFPGETICTNATPTTATCGSVADPVTYVTVGGGALDDTIDLSGLAAQKRSAGAFAPVGPYDADSRTRGMYTHVLGGPGADVVRGGAAGAGYELGDGDDTVTGGSADEIFRGETTDDGDDTFDGGAGYDTVSYSRRKAAVGAAIGDATTVGNGDIAAHEADTLTGVEAISGSSAADVLAITGSVDGLGTLLGNAGNDTLTGGPRTDKLIGGDGADELHGESGDDLLIDSRGSGEAQGHLHGGPGDDELIQRGGLAGPTVRQANGAPTCGAGTDVLRATPGLDEGVTNTAGPADCEYLDQTASDAKLVGEPRVGKTVGVELPAGLPNAPYERVTKVDWYLCAAGGFPFTCSTQTSSRPTLTLGAADAALRLERAVFFLTEPLSQAPRWVEERAARPTSISASGSTFTVSFVPAATVQAFEPAAAQPGRAPTPVAKPDGMAVAKALTTSLGRKPKLSLLKKPVALRFYAPGGTSVTARVSTKKGRRSIALAAGSATAGRDGEIALTLTPTSAGRKAAKRKKALRVSVAVTAKNAGGASSATTRISLKKR